MKFYRYEIDYNRSSIYGVVVKCNIYLLQRETECGFWISDGILDKWILKKSKKRFAYPTKNEAKINFIKRKEKYIKILEDKLWLTKQGIKQINKQDE